MRVIYRPSAACLYQRAAAIYFHTGIWPTGLGFTNYRLRWSSEGPKTSINPHMESDHVQIHKG
jgi:hypothetical protein